MRLLAGPSGDAGQGGGATRVGVDDVAVEPDDEPGHGDHGPTDGDVDRVEPEPTVAEVGGRWSEPAGRVVAGRGQGTDPDEGETDHDQ